MQIELTKKQYRRLLDMVYIGNWVLNSARGRDRFQDYDEVQSVLFAQAPKAGMDALMTVGPDCAEPSAAFCAGGIHEAIQDYEDSVFFDILAEELARRDMNDAPIDETNMDELNRRIEEYMTEFEAHGTDNVQVTTE